MNFNIDTEEGMANAVAWQQKMIDVLADGGRWVVPRSGTIYMIDKTNKRARKVLGLKPEPTITRVFEAMGWTVEGNDKPLSNPRGLNYCDVCHTNGRTMAGGCENCGDPCL